LRDIKCGAGGVIEYTIKIRIPGWCERILVAPVLLYRFLRFGYTFRRIRLTKGRYAIVDPKDYEWLSKYRWGIQRGRRTNYAARRTEQRPGVKRKYVFMHKEIMKEALAAARVPGPGPRPTKLVVDHINHNGLDNRRANLRVATLAENCRNRRKQKKPTSSKYKGVSWEKVRGQWRAVIRTDNGNISLGYFRSELAAARAYDEAAKTYHGRFASLNFPDDA